MASGKVYYYDFSEHIFGDYQANFNFNLVLDETKDSCKVVVLTMSDTILKPNTIVKLEHIDTWWCVKKDTRNRTMNEVGFLYEHTLELQGAFEIFNSRDLINCGFNTNHYSVGDVLNRLINLSSYELPVNFDFGNYLESGKVVDYLKTFENYTLASAIKEFLNGYNCLPKMSFVLNSENEIVSAIIKIYSKSGLTDTPLSEDVFNETSAVDNIDRESYATKVISNIQNCVARKPIRFPRIGATYPIGDNGQITYQTASQCKVKLPSNIYSVESITFYPVVIVQMHGRSNTIDNYRGYINPDDLSRNCNELKKTFKQRIIDSGGTQEDLDQVDLLWLDFVEQLHARLPKVRNGGYYDAIEDAPHGNYMQVFNYGHSDPMKVYLNNERYAMNNDGVDNYVLSWKQSGNEIKGFEFFTKAQYNAGSYDETSLYGIGSFYYYFNHYYIFVTGETHASLIDNEFTMDGTHFDCPRTLVSVEYIPMSDIKFKTDNNIVGEDTKLYNQNGKLVDSYAVSKLVNSYCKSIRDKDLIRFGTYYNFNEIPKLGARVGDYVINNISYDVYDNDNGGFVYKCQFALNLYSICKSTMINAHTNIRDYDCPQSNNIRRIQTYRDYVEISYDYTSNDITYLDKSKMLHIGLDYIGVKDNLVFVMQATDDSFDNEGDNHSHNYYYHLDHISYDLSKQKKIIVDFGDNNIVGYGYAHAYKPFALSNFFDNDKAITVPISYVNNYGGVTGITLMASENDIADENFDGIFISENVAISHTIYNRFLNNFILDIYEPNYNKDGLEIPIFEYSCEIGGDDNIEVADNFFEYEENFDNFVAVKFDYPINNENANMLANGTMVNVTVSFVGNEMTIETASGRPTSAKGHWGIYAKKGANYRFLFALNNYAVEYIDGTKLSCYFNFYKLK